MQIQGELLAEQDKVAGRTSTAQRTGMLRTALGICKDEGVIHLWNGILPALYRHIIYSGIRMALYEKIRDDIVGKNADGSFPVWKVEHLRN